MTFSLGLTDRPFSYQDGSPRPTDGIGVYTQELYHHIQKKLPVKRIYSQPLTRGISPQLTTDHWIQPYYPSVVPQYFYKPLVKYIDLLHVTNYAVPLIKKLPIVWTVHDAIMLKNRTLQNLSWWRWKKRVNRLKRCMRYVNRIITISHTMKQEISEYWEIPKDKINVVYHGVNAQWFSTIKATIRENILQKYSLQKPYFLFAGTLQDRKNISGILSAYQNLPQRIKDNYDLVFVGKLGGRLLNDKTQQLIQQLQQEKQIHWLSYIDFDDLRAVYQSAHALVFPSFEEGFGFPILEGYASGIPVITSNFGATAEVADDAAYLVDPYQVDNIRQAMIDLVENIDERNTFIEKGLVRAHQFSWKRCAEETMAVYQKVLEK